MPWRATSSELMFTGELGSISRDGNKLRAKFALGSGAFDANMPVATRGRLCSHLKGSNADGSFLISAGCTLLKSDWKFTATVANPVSIAYPFTLTFAGLARAVGAAPTYFANWFAYGRVEWGAGANLQRRGIMSSTVPVAGAFAVNLHRYFRGVPQVGDVITIYPGCPGTRAACMAYDAGDNTEGKFNNYDNFWGNHFAPVGDPSTSGLPTLGTHGGKK